MRLLRDLFSGVDNQRWELARALAASSVTVYSGTLITGAAQGHQLDFSAIGIGYAALLGGAGALIWAKDTAKTASVAQANKDAIDANIGA